MMMMNNKLVLAAVFASSLLGGTTTTTFVDAARSPARRRATKSSKSRRPVVVEDRCLVVDLACAVGSGGCDPSTSTVVGEVKFFPPVRGVSNGLTKIVYDISGLIPDTFHGMHVHTEQISSGGCESAAGHYDPLGVNHGTTLSQQRHPGDMGSVLADSDGNAVGTMRALTPLFNTESKIVGRSVVLHANADDNGLGGDDSSRANGKAGARIACGDLIIVSP